MSAARIVRARRLAVFLACGLLACTADAQDFGGAPLALPRGACALLEHALPGEARWAMASSATRWWGLPDLTTRAIAVQAPAGALRVAVGLSQTGEPAIGWTTVGLGLGAVSARGGGGVRAALRRDRAADAGLAGAGAWGEGVGGEVGAGAWLRPAPGIEVWASAPQLHTRGLAPPLARVLHVGASAQSGDLGAWAALSGSRPGAEAAERTLGAWLASGPHAVWLAARDGPWRGSGGLTLAWRGMRMGCGIETHPVLDETVQLSIAWER